MTMNLFDLLDRREVCRFFGGNRPLNAATLYRGIRKGRYPAPVKVGPGSSRWLRSECEAALQTMAAGKEKVMARSKASGNHRPGGGIASRVNVEKPVRTGKGAKAIVPAGASQLGQRQGNHVTEQGAKSGDRSD